MKPGGRRWAHAMLAEHLKQNHDLAKADGLMRLVRKCYQIGYEIGYADAKAGKELPREG